MRDKLIGFRPDPQLRDEIDRCIEKNPLLKNRSEFLRFASRDFLKKEERRLKRLESKK